MIQKYLNKVDPVNPVTGKHCIMIGEIPDIYSRNDTFYWRLISNKNSLVSCWGRIIFSVFVTGSKHNSINIIRT